MNSCLLNIGAVRISQSFKNVANVDVKIFSQMLRASAKLCSNFSEKRFGTCCFFLVFSRQ